MIRASSSENNASATSCVVNALVEATPISGPARVISTRPASRTIEDSGTLQIAIWVRYARCLASFSAASVSAVSPDWEMVEEQGARPSPRGSR